jgi:hypothetical protein
MRRFLLLPLCLLFALFSGKEGSPQTRTIINTEKQAPSPNEGFHSSIDANGSVATGNIDLINLNANGMLGFREPEYWLRILGGSTYFEQNGTEYLDNHYGQIRYSRFFGEKRRWQSYHFAQYQSNLTLILKERGIIGSGIRRSFPFQDTGHFDLGGGIMWEYERLDRSQLRDHEGTFHRNFRFTTVFVLRRALNENVTLLNTSYVQPRVTNLRDIRALEELSLLTKLTEHFQFDVTFYWRTDTRPPEIVVPSDIGVDLGLLLEF